MEDEFAFIDSITPKKTYQSRVRVGIGDDAAVYESDSRYEEVVCVDTMVEGIHFRKDTLSARQIGRKALGINVSDLAAMGARPQFYLVAIAIPTTWSADEVREIYKGMNLLADPLEMDLIGGDTVSSPSCLMITVTAIGVVEAGRALKRSMAQPGDVVFVTGPVGGSAAGFSLLNEQTRHGVFTAEEQHYILCHQEVAPQVALGRICASSGGRIALNDVSDGLASEAHELAVASGVQLVLDREEIVALSPQLHGVDEETGLKWSLYGGEDFQLLGTTSKDQLTSLQQQASAIGRSFYPVGSVRAGVPSVYIKKEEQEVLLAKKGFNHFRHGDENDETKV
ncbi:thiamine-phosphate kinase [Bacillus sp. FSL W7-1360]